MDLYDLREEYISESFSENDTAPVPIDQFKLWFGEAASVKTFEPNAAILATANVSGFPSARVILVKAFSEKGFDFFTNYESRKGRELSENPKASIVFYWSELERQVRIEGTVEKLSAEESDGYFETRPTGSRLGAWASPQSQVIEGREWLEKAHTDFREKFKKGEIPRPDNWGGYRLVPIRIEFWQGRANRLHDRILYSLENNIWKIQRLAP
jgi:pyridoxamine 5'-phosphate oxidase